MPIDKIIEIRNVARIHAYAAKGDVSFRRVNLIYGQNGQGKTSLTAILRSWSIGDAAPINERTTLGQGGSSTVTLLADKKKVTFDGTAWSTVEPNLVVYDATFVTENVYTGDSVDQKHRRNLYEVIVGSANVAIARRIAEIDGKTRTLSDDLSRAEAEIRKSMLAPFDLTEFLHLKARPRDELDSEIVRLESLLAAARNSALVLSRADLEAVAAPTMPEGINHALAVTFASLHEQASRLLGDHLRRLGRAAEEWLFQGVSKVHDDSCPFCAQDVTHNQLVSAYGDYFSEEYRTHQQHVRQLLNEVDRMLGTESVHRLTTVFASNSARADKWADLIDLSFVKAPVADAQPVLELLRQLLRDALNEKLRAPAEPVEVGSELAAASADLERFVTAISEYNAFVARANRVIAETKKAAASTNPAEIESELRRLKNTIIRDEIAVAAACAAYLEALDKKKRLAAEKDELKAQLSERTSEVLRKYEVSINALLKRFGANFRISGSKPAYAGGKASSSYKIAINECEVDIAAPPGKPGFRVLSAGDRTGLALAFFIAQLQNDPELGKKTVVIDDPISSLDQFRASCTRYLLTDIGGQAAQLIVLSHDPFFLKGLHDAAERLGVKCLHFRRVGTTIELAEWDATQAALTTTHQERLLLQRYLEGDADVDQLAVARAVRPYIEGMLRFRYPEDFPEGKWLGDFIGVLREATTNHRLFKLKTDLSDLEMVNEYSKHFHHDGTSMPRTVVEDAELRSHVEAALRIGSGGPST